MSSQFHSSYSVMFVLCSFKLISDKQAPASEEYLIFSFKCKHSQQSVCCELKQRSRKQTFFSAHFPELLPAGYGFYVLICSFAHYVKCHDEGRLGVWGDFPDTERSEIWRRLLDSKCPWATCPKRTLFCTTFTKTDARIYNMWCSAGEDSITEKTKLVPFLL